MLNDAFGLILIAFCVYFLACMVDNALEIMKICEEKLNLGEGEAAQSMVMAAAMLAGNDHNILGLIKMMLETYETINEGEAQ